MYTHTTLTSLGSILINSKRAESMTKVSWAKKASSLKLVKFIQKLILVTRPAVKLAVAAPVDVLIEYNI